MGQDSQIRSDFHMHSGHSHDVGNGTKLATIRDESRAAGVREIGISEHLNNRKTDAHLRASRAEYDTLADDENFHFGVEASTLRDWDLQMEKERGETATPYGHYDGGPLQPPQVYLPDEVREEMNFEYVIAGVHWFLGVAGGGGRAIDESDTEAIVRNWHEQQMCIVTHPNVDVLVHPWWWYTVRLEPEIKVLGLPWSYDFGVIPRSMHEELAAAARDNNTAIELSGVSFFEQHEGHKTGQPDEEFPAPPREQYLEFHHLLKDAGVTFSIGSDSHGPGYDDSKVLQLSTPLESLGLTDADLWHPPAK